MKPGDYVRYEEHHRQTLSTLFLEAYGLGPFVMHSFNHGGGRVYLTTVDGKPMQYTPGDPTNKNTWWSHSPGDLTIDVFLTAAHQAVLASQGGEDEAR